MKYICWRILEHRTELLASAARRTTIRDQIWIPANWQCKEHTTLLLVHTWGQCPKPIFWHILVSKVKISKYNSMIVAIKLPIIDQLNILDSLHFTRYSFSNSSNIQNNLHHPNSTFHKLRTLRSTENIETANHDQITTERSHLKCLKSAGTPNYWFQASVMTSPGINERKNLFMVWQNQLPKNFFQQASNIYRQWWQPAAITDWSDELSTVNMENNNRIPNKSSAPNNTRPWGLNLMKYRVGALQTWSIYLQSPVNQ